MARKTILLGARVKPETKAALERAAADDNRSAASLTEVILSSWLKERGYLDPTPDNAKK